MKTSNIAISVILIGLAGFVLMQTRHLPFGTLQVPQTAFFPAILATLLLGFSFILLAQTLVAAPERRWGADRIAAEGWVRIGATLAAMVAFALVLERLGFLLTTFLLMVLLLRAVESQRWPKVVGIAVTAALISYALFGWLLGIPLPAGVLGI
jgi:putative tricarboxylic transport membrane protein